MEVLLRLVALPSVLHDHYTNVSDAQMFLKSSRQLIWADEFFFHHSGMICLGHQLMCHWDKIMAFRMWLPVLASLVVGSGLILTGTLRSRGSNFAKSRIMPPYLQFQPSSQERTAVI